MERGEGGMEHTGRATILAPFEAASSITFLAFLMFSALLSDTVSWQAANLNIGFELELEFEFEFEFEFSVVAIVRDKKLYRGLVGRCDKVAMRETQVKERVLYTKLV